MFESLKNIQDVEFFESADLSRYSTMRLKANSPLAIIKSINGVQNFVKIANENKIEYRMLGWGANQLIVDQASFVYLHLEFEFDESILGSAKNSYKLPASLSLAKLTSHAAKFGVSGWQVFTGIPASLGGAIFMNAGTNLGEIGSVVKEVGIIDKTGKEYVHKVGEDSFSYRHNKFCGPGEVIVWAELVHFGTDEKITKQIKDYLKLRNDTQPLREATCGCMFKNAQVNGMTCRAGQSIDIMGLKGLSFGGVRVSHKHANFMENVDNSSRADVLKLSQLVQDELKLTLGVNFELEVDTGER